MGDGRPVVVAARGRSRRAAGVLVLVACLLVAGCNRDNDGAGGGGALEEARTALRARAQLLVAGDVNGYLATVARPARALETRIARGAAAVPLSFVNISFTPRRPAARDATVFEAVPVRVVYKYEGLPEDNVFEFALRYDVERQGDQWTVTKSVAEPDEPMPIWAREEVEVSRSDHFLAIHLPGLGDAARSLELAEQARSQLAARLHNVQSDEVHLVLLARNHDELELVTEESFPDDVVAAASSGLVPFALPEHRHMAVNLEALFGERARVEGEADEVEPVEVFQHELAHLALSRFDDPFMPAWVAEGAAMFLSGERRIESWRFATEEGLFDDVSLFDFVDHDSLDGLAYAYANAAFFVLERDFGADAVWEFYVTFRPLAPSQAYVANPSGPALQRVFGINETELDQRTKEYIRKAVEAGG